MRKGYEVILTVIGYKIAHYLVLLVLLVMWLSAPPHSFALITGVTVASVSVRTNPNGDVVDSLKAGTVVGVLKVTGEWVQVMYFPTPDAKNVKTGWVGLKYIRITSRGRTTGGDDCETEYKTGAEVCVTVTDTQLSCRKDFSGDWYRGCEVLVEYELTTNYSGRAYLDVDVECEVEIRYTGPGMYGWRSNSSSEDESHSLYAHGSESDSFTFDFSFGYYNKVTQVRIDSARCEIRSVDLW